MSSKTPLFASIIKPPAIRVLSADDGRPLWSVMIPTYNARADYLEKTLNSVLQQDPGPKQMQVEVADEGSVDISFEVRHRIFNKPQVAHYAGQKHRKLLALKPSKINP